MINNNGYKLPTEQSDLIVDVLITLAENSGYIVFHEQQKLLRDKDYIKEWKLCEY